MKQATRGSLPLLSLLAGMAALAACGHPAEPPLVLGEPGPLPAAVQRQGDPELGYEILVNRGYVSCGVPYAAYAAAAAGREPGPRLPGRQGRNAELPYDLNATVDANGVELVVSNCLACHGGRFNGELVIGLGNAFADFTEDPMRQIASRTAEYWRQRFAARIRSATLGIYLANDAGTGDMIFDVSTEDGDNATADNRWSYDGFVDAVGTMGENADALALMGVHPDTMTQMRKQQAIEYIQDSETGILIPTYNGKRLVEDKGLPVIAGGTSGFKYVSVLYKAGAFGYGEGSPKYPTAIEMDELAGNGAGVETLVERKEWIIHPEGYAWQEDTVTGQSPTISEFETAANWARVFDRENVGLAFFVHN